MHTVTMCPVHICTASALTLLLTCVLADTTFYYVTPTPSTECFGGADVPCFTLSQYARNSSNFASDTSIVLLPGNHSLEVEFTVRNITSLTIYASHLDTMRTSINCGQSARFRFENIDSVTLIDLDLIGCTNNVVSLVNLFSLEHSSLQGLGRNGTGLQVIDSIRMNIFKSSLSCFTGLVQDHGPQVRGVGGAIFANTSRVNATYRISECTFANNKASGYYGIGGAVYIEPLGIGCDSNVIIDGSTFIENTVTGGLSAEGGAVWTGACSVQLFNSTFVNNRQSGHVVSGGVVWANSSTTINSSLFINNTASGNSYVRGGVVWAHLRPLVVVNSTFVSNNANTNNDIYGGILWVNSSSHAVIDSSTFMHNTATAQMIGGGGAILCLSSYLAVSNSSFRDNILNGNSSSISIGGTLFAYTSTIKLFNSTFINNSLTGYISEGGAVWTNASISVLNQSTFINNSVAGYREASGGAVLATQSNVTIYRNTFISNSLTGNISRGGAVWTDASFSVLNQSTFINNRVVGYILASGGAVISILGTTTINQSAFDANTLIGYRLSVGGALYAQSNMTIKLSKFINNTVYGGISEGGAIFVGAIFAGPFTGSTGNGENETTDTDTLLSTYSYTSLLNVNFTRNTAIGALSYGGALVTVRTICNINKTTFDINKAISEDLSQGSHGGAVFTYKSSILLNNCVFKENNVTGYGGGLALLKTNLSSNGFLDILSNTADSYVMFARESRLDLSGNTTFSNNYGLAFLAFNCFNISYTGYLNIMNNKLSSNRIITNLGISQEEGTVALLNSYDVVFNGTINIMNNTAVRGGAISATHSKITLHGDVSIEHNVATISGGGIYALQCDIYFTNINNISLIGNEGNKCGGGIHALSSYFWLTDSSKIFVVNNHAERGGGVCLELNSKLYVYKNAPEIALNDNYINLNDSSHWIRLEFIENTADYGGAMYIADATNSVTCNSLPFGGESTLSSECFIQSIRTTDTNRLFDFNNLADPNNPIDSTKGVLFAETNLLNSYFTNNTAAAAGNSVYGGLLDRCTINPTAEVLFNGFSYQSPSSMSATAYLLTITDLTAEDYSSTVTVSSDAVRVCFCKDNQPDCSYQAPPVSVNKGQSFNVSLVAVDQVNNTISSSIVIHGYVDLPASLGEGQSIQLTNENGTCTNLTYSILSTRKGDLTEYLHLYADGPCTKEGISLANILVHVSPCPVGFTAKDTKCDCNYERLGTDYIHNCSIDEGTVMRKEGVWFSYSNVTGYSHFQGCPFDFCLPSRVPVNLNTPTGSDAQCSFNRSGVLCGSCKDGLSLTLGSTRCKKCSNHWLALLIVFATAGVLLVSFLLALNLTVAVGTINGLIFYANIVSANPQLFFQGDEILSIFIAWLNFDLGFESCLYNGMSYYVYMWLLHVFPVYVILLVVMVIIVSQCSTKFSKLLSNRNPISTLATLILLLYARLLRTTIGSLSFAKMTHSNSTTVTYETVWYLDGNVPYLKGKHIPLFLLALVILIIGIVFSFLLFFWQWLLHLPNRRPFKWIHSTQLNSFIDAYSAPYTAKHRYWTGLLLFVRSFLYVVFSAINVEKDPRVNLLSTIIVIGILIMYMALVSKVYKQWPLFFLELWFLFNLIFLCSANLYNKVKTPGPTYVLVGIAFITFLAIVIYHIYKYIGVINRCVNKAWDQISRKKNTNLPMQLSASNIYSINMAEKTPSSSAFTKNEKVYNFTELREPILEDVIVVEKTDSDRYNRARVRHKDVGTQTLTTGVIDGPSEEED